MEPITSAVIGYAADKLVDVVESAVKTHVIERWSRRRAREFFEAFCKCLVDVGTTDSEIRAKLDELLSDETRSTIVFDAYRSVCLTKSKTLGPRVIAVLTAELVVTSRLSDYDDDLIFSAAEEMSDIELEGLEEYVAMSLKACNEQADNRIKQLTDGSIEIPEGVETFDSNWLSQTRKSIGPIDLATGVGLWALKAKRLGLLSDDVREKQWRYEEDSERHIDEPGVAREISWFITLSPACLRLARFISVAAEQ